MGLIVTLPQQPHSIFIVSDVTRDVEVKFEDGKVMHHARCRVFQCVTAKSTEGKWVDEIRGSDNLTEFMEVSECQKLFLPKW